MRLRPKQGAPLLLSSRLQGLAVVALVVAGVDGLAGVWWALIAAAPLLFLDLLT